MIGTLAFGIFGLVVLLAIALVFSDKRSAIDWRLVAAGIGLQLLFGVLVILVPGGRQFFEALSRVFVRVISFSLDGAAFIFGSLADPSNLGFIFAFPNQAKRLRLVQSSSGRTTQMSSQGRDSPLPSDSRRHAFR